MARCSLSLSLWPRRGAAARVAVDPARLRRVSGGAPGGKGEGWRAGRGGRPGRPPRPRRRPPRPQEGGGTRGAPNGGGAGDDTTNRTPVRDRRGAGGWRGGCTAAAAGLPGGGGGLSSRQPQNVAKDRGLGALFLPSVSKLRGAPPADRVGSSPGAGCGVSSRRVSSTLAFHRGRPSRGASPSPLVWLPGGGGPRLRCLPSTSLPGRRRAARPRRWSPLCPRSRCPRG